MQKMRLSEVRANGLFKEAESAGRETRIKILTELVECPQFDKKWSDAQGKPLYSALCLQIAKDYGDLTNYHEAAEWEGKAKEFGERSLPRHLP